MWRHRSFVMKLASLDLSAAVLLHAVVLVARHWAETPGGATFGIWAVMLSQVEVPEGTVPLLFVSFSVVSLLVILGCTTLNLVFLHSKFLVVMPAMITFSFISGLMLMVVVILWCLPLSSHGYTMGWTFYVAIVAVILDIGAASLCVAEFATRWHQTLPDFQRRQGPVSPLHTEDPDQSQDETDMQELQEL